MGAHSDIQLGLPPQMPNAPLETPATVYGAVASYVIAPHSSNPCVAAYALNPT